MNVVLIYNPKSGSHHRLPYLRALFKSNGLTITYSFTINQLASLKLRQLINRGVTVAAVGGDGTINAVGRLLVHTKSTLLPLPGGTLNHFARDVGMPQTVEESVEASHKFKQYVVDVGHVNDELFLNNSSVGIYPFTLIEREKANKLLGKWPAMAIAVIKQLGRFHRPYLVIDGKPVRSPFVFIGNNKYDIASSLIPERKRIADGILTMMVATSASRIAFLKAGMAVISGRATKRDDFVLSYRKKVSIYSRQPELPVSFDGEVKRLQTPLEYRIEPKALKILSSKAR